MNKTHTHKPIPIAVTMLIALFSAAAALAFSGGGAAHAHANTSHASSHASRTISRSEFTFRNELRKLWEDHVTWTRLAIISLTTDSPDKVIAFYRKQLSKYGVVLVCSEGKPISAGPSELKCEENKDHTGTELKVGTEQKQHIVGVNTKDGRTEFGIVYLEKTKRGDI